MPDQAVPIEPGRGRLRYDKTRRTIVAEKPLCPDGDLGKPARPFAKTFSAVAVLKRMFRLGSKR